MNKVLVSAALALSLIASGNAFAAGSDKSVYAETPSASYDAGAVQASNAPLSAATAAIYSETTSSDVASVQMVGRFEQLADSGIRLVLPE